MANVLELEEIAVGLENFLEVAIAKFCHQIDLGKII